MATKVKSKVEEYKINIYDMNAKKIDTLDLDKRIFDGKVNTALLHQVMVMYAACSRKGTASTKTRSEVRGGGRKPWRQKGTGRARFGSIRNPIWRGGGVAFGPHHRDYSYSLPRKIRLTAVKSMLNSKLKDKLLLVIDEIKLDESKTKRIKGILDKFKVGNKVLIISDKLNDDIKRASRNLKNVKVMEPETLCSDDLLRYQHLLITKVALQKLTKRLLQ